MTIEEVKKWIEESGSPSTPNWITHNQDAIFIQFPGWSIDLKDGGKWYITITEGG